MPNLIIIHIHPVDPVDGADFTNFLDGLTITAYDISFANVTTDLESLKIDANRVGDPASFVPPDLDDANPDPGNRIFQHFGPPPDLDPYSVASAVIILPAGGTEFEHPDLLLSIERNGDKIIDHSYHYNAAIISVPDPADPPGTVGYVTDLGMAARAADPSLFLALPAQGQGVGSGTPYVELPESGAPPKYDELLEAVNDVLADDPGPPVDLTNLTPAQCRHIANEIVWNRDLAPLPLPPSNLSTDPPPLEYLYTGQPGTDLGGTLKEAQRKRFEGEVQSYYATRNAEAERLGRYIYSLSAALYCERKSKEIDRVTLRFPPRPNAADAKGKIKEAQVVLK